MLWKSQTWTLAIEFGLQSYQGTLFSLISGKTRGGITLARHKVKTIGYRTLTIYSHYTEPDYPQQFSSSLLATTKHWADGAGMTAGEPSVVSIWKVRLPWFDTIIQTRKIVMIYRGGQEVAKRIVAIVEESELSLLGLMDFAKMCTMNQNMKD